MGRGVRNYNKPSSNRQQGQCVSFRPFESWLQDGRRLTGRKCGINKDPQRDGCGRAVDQMVDQVIAISIDTKVVYLAHLRTEYGGGKFSQKGGKRLALQRHALDFVLVAHGWLKKWIGESGRGFQEWPNRARAR